MPKDIQVEAVYQEDLESRARLYVLALIELAREQQAVEEAPDAAVGQDDNGREPGGGDDDD